MESGKSAVAGNPLTKAVSDVSRQEAALATMAKVPGLNGEARGTGWKCMGLPSGGYIRRNGERLSPSAVPE
jgi:hypothetical protein